MPYGRGGAGNIQAATQERDRIAADTEAQHTIEPEIAPSISHDQDAQQYKHTGRGGAGNYSTAEEVKAAQHAEQQSSSATATPGSATATAPKYGRGGAGNIAFVAEGREVRDERVNVEVVKMKERVAKAVESHVEEALAFPEKAKVAHE